MTEVFFTPRKSEKSDERLRMRISREDQLKTGRGPWTATITDLNTGCRYQVKGVPCSLPECHCDAAVVAEITCDEVTDEKDELREFVCVDCAVNTHHNDEYYMVHDHVWGQEAGMEPHGGMLCIGCLEARILRRLTKDDFTDAPVNFIFPQSERLKDRLKGKSPLEMEAAA